MIMLPFFMTRTIVIHIAYSILIFNIDIGSYAYNITQI